MTQQTILITGGAGFIGSNIAAALCARGTHRIVICDSFGTGDKWRNLARHPVYEIITPAQIWHWLEASGASLDAVIHMGAISSTTEADVDLILENNFTLSGRLYRWCAEHKKRFIYASSAATYGDGAQGFEDDGSLAALNMLRPLNAYGWSKHLVDRHIAMAQAASEPAPPQCVGLKFFNVYGPNEYHKASQRSVVCVKFPDAKADQPVRLFKSYHPDFADGGQKRDFIYIKDCVSIVLWCFDNPHVSGLFNVGTGAARSFEDLARALFSALEKPPVIEFFAMPEMLRDKYQYFTQSRISRLRAAGYTAPFTTLENGVREYVQQYLLKDDPYL